MRRGVIVCVAAAVALAGAGSGATVAIISRSNASTPSRAATDRACEPAYVTPHVANPRSTLPNLELREVANLDAPTAIAFHPSGVAIVGLRNGRLLLIRDEEVDRRPLVDLSDDTADGGDAGLLSLIYDPAGEWLYVYRATAGLDELLTAYPAPGGIPDPDGEVVILAIDHPPSEMHHGGGLAFGPDGALYVGTGDGGGLGDPEGRAQRLDTLLGKILRIVPTPASAEPYRVPDDNPFVDRDGALPEIFSFGLRNPFTLSFDGRTDDLWIADVGQSCWEEIDFRPAGRQGGENFGWDHREGTHAFEGGGDDHVLPIHDYSHRNGWCVIIGGFVYHGRDIPELGGAYLFTDYCKGELVALWQQDGRRVALEQTTVETERPVSIVEDLAGEPWIVSLEGGIYKLERVG